MGSIPLPAYASGFDFKQPPHPTSKAPNIANVPTGNPLVTTSADLSRDQNAICYSCRMPNEENEWKSCVTMLHVLTPTGRKFGPVMRRKTIDGTYEYREMNDTESKEYLSEEMW
jgi:hypothetical protein